MSARSELRYHVPRSQVWGGSGGRQSGKVHIHLVEPFAAGRLSRGEGEALCGRRGWYEREDGGEEKCPRCLDLAKRYGVEVPAAS